MDICGLTHLFFNLLNNPMKKLLLAAATLWGGWHTLQAQQTSTHSHFGVPCLYDHAIEQRAQSNPQYRQALQQAFAEAQRIGSQHDHQRNVLTVPVVIHIVWKNAAENLHDSLIQQQIDVLNEDYQRLNPDTTRLRNRFLSIAGNPQIQFRLDTVIRKYTDSLFYSGGLFPDVSVSDKVKQDCRGGDNAWDVERYLNIWICNMGTSGVLGFAYPPDNLPNWPSGSAAPTKGLEGVVLDYRVIGRRGVYSVSSPFGGSQTINTQGRTATHECGHYLGLRHIWGDAGLSSLGIPDCSGTDGVNDTPTQGMASQFQCDTTQNTCNASTAGDEPDMIENYMDYSSESCMNTFTQGQVTILRGTLLAGGARYKLTQNTGLATPPANDRYSQASIIQVDTNNNCSNLVAGSTQNANPSYMASCATAPYDYDVWYSFVATHTSVSMELRNKIAHNGTSTDMAYQLFGNVCGTPQSLACGIADAATFTNLTPNMTYYLRLMSNDSVARQSFNVCLNSQGTVMGVQHNAIEQQIHIYPNPTNGQFAVAIPSQLAANSTLAIRNALGQLVSQPIALDNQSNLVQLDLSTLSSGIYIVEIRTTMGTIAKRVQLNK